MYCSSLTSERSLQYSLFLDKKLQKTKTASDKKQDRRSSPGAFLDLLRGNLLHSAARCSLSDTNRCSARMIPYANASIIAMIFAITSPPRFLCTYFLPPVNLSVKHNTSSITPTPTIIQSIFSPRFRFPDIFIQRSRLTTRRNKTIPRCLPPSCPAQSSFPHPPARSRTSTIWFSGR